MPKKTREEKILARLHRLEQTQPISLPVAGEPEANKEKRGGGVRLEEIQPTQPNPKTVPSGTKVDYSFVRADLRKTITLTFLAILLEIILSLTLRSSHVL